MQVLHSVPLFYKCVISVTGASAEERQQMGHHIQTNGGKFSVDLTINCTHLIVMPIAIKASRRASPKLEFAQKWNIPLVSFEWFQNSLQRDSCLDGEEYKVVPANTTSSTQSTMGPTQTFLYEDLTAEEVVAISLPPYLEGLHIYVGDRQPTNRLLLLKRLVLGAGGTRYADLFDRSLITHYVVHNQTLTPRDQELLKQWEDGHRPIIVHDQWLFACFYAKARVPIEPFLISFETVTPPPEPTTVSNNPNLKSIAPKQTIWSLKNSTTTSTKLIESISVHGAESDVSSHLPLFSGLRFRLLFDGDPIKSAQLTELIEGQGGVIIGVEDQADFKQSSPKQVDFTVASLIISSYSASDIPPLLLNELWLEACVQEDRVIDIHPVPYYFCCLCETSPKVEYSGIQFSSLKISQSGFTGWEREYLGRLALCLGAAYTENLSRRNTHLISAQPSGPKYDFAQGGGIWCVQKEWLLESAKKRQPLPETKYPILITASEKENSKLKTNESNSIEATNNESMNTTKRPREMIVEKVINKKSKEGINSPSKESNSTSLSNTTDISTLFRGLIFSISQRIWHRKEEMHDLVIEMGGTFIWSFEKCCTHYIHQGNMIEESFREFKLVRQYGKTIVSPWWLIKCKEAGKLLSEAEYSHTFNPETLTCPKLDLIPMAIKSAPDPSSSDTVINNNASLPPTNIDFAAILAANQEKQKTKLPSVTFELTPLIKTLAPAEKSLAPPEKLETKIFAFSALNNDQRTSFPKLLSGFGAICLTNTTTWDPSTTHLIIGTLSKSEKLLCACAAGKWVLRPEYVDACEVAGRLVEERPYEWTPAWGEGELSRVPRYWREAKKRAEVGAFGTWRVLLVADQKRQGSLKAILQAGNAQVVELGDESNLESMVSNLTHVLISSPQMKTRISHTLQKALSNKFYNVEMIADRLLNIDSL